MGYKTKIEVSRQVSVNFGGFPTVGQLRDFVLSVKDLPDHVTVAVRAGDSQIDGAYCTFTVTEKS